MAVETSADLLTQLRQEVGFDVDGGDATLVGWLNAAHRLMVARTGCYRRRTVIAGGTVVGQSDYTIPSDVLWISTVEVGGVRFDRASREEVIDARNSQAIFLSRDGEGVVSQGAGNAGVETLTIFPAPTSAGTEIALFGPVRAPEMDGTAATSPVIPPEFFSALIDRAASIGLRRTEDRVAEGQAYASEFDTACEELRRQTRRRWNTGPSRVRIAWPSRA